MTYRVVLERDFCIGYGCCVEIAPEAFELDEANVVRLKDEEAPSRVEDPRLMEAARACPVAAIHLFDEEGEQAYPAYE
ncbi:MAG: ferredoxin [Armatimonadetes bacterium]|nr:ferredoxin [Armatimonadota bacterium]